MPRRRPRPWGAGALFLLTLAACPGSLSATDAETRLRNQLQATGELREHLRGGETLDLRKLHFSDVVIAMHGDVAEVLAHAEATGSVGDVSLQYVGSERLLLNRQGDGYVGRLLPALVGVLEAVAERQRAISAQDQAALLALAAADYRDGSVDRARLGSLFDTLWPTVERTAPNALAVRVDRDRAVVSLHFEGDGGSHTHTLVLESEAKTWRYSAGLL